MEITIICIDDGCDTDVYSSASVAIPNRNATQTYLKLPDCLSCP